MLKEWNIRRLTVEYEAADHPLTEVVIRTGSGKVSTYSAHGFESRLGNVRPFTGTVVTDVFGLVIR